MPKEDSVKVQIIRLKNQTPRRRKLRLVYYIKPVIGEDEIKTSKFMDIRFDKNNNMILAKNIVNTDYRDVMFISSSEKIKSYTGIKAEFFGDGGLSNPEGLKLDNFSNRFVNKIGNIIAMDFEIELDSLGYKEFSIILGAGNTTISCQDLAYKYGNVNNCIQENGTIRRYWAELLNTIQVKTPVESMNLLLNGWVMYQTISSRLMGRTGFYQSGGAYGFRDQLQDVISVKYIDPEITRNQILLHSRHQFIEGDVEHWWHEETRKRHTN